MNKEPAESIQKILQTYPFQKEKLAEWIQILKTEHSIAQVNTVSGDVRPLPEEDICHLPEPHTHTHQQYLSLGMDALRNQKAAVVILAGGMATRFGGVIKANVKAIEDFSFLEIKIKDIKETAKRINTPIPCWIMTSFSTHEALSKEAVRLSSALCPIQTFPQTVSLRLQKSGELFRDQHGEVSPYTPGHGDLPFALKQAGLLDTFIQNGGEIVMMSNVDNLTATFDPAIVGFHLSHSNPITAELVKKEPGDQGGAPAVVDGQKQIVEAFRFPHAFDQNTIPYFNTNTFTFDATALNQDYAFSWFIAEKEVEGKTAIQFERLIGELTAMLPTQYLCVPRHGKQGRFHPIKTPAHLKTQVKEIRSILENRISKNMFKKNS